MGPRTETGVYAGRERRAIGHQAAALVLLALLARGARAEPDEAMLGKDLGYPVGTAATWSVQPFTVGSWSALDQVRGLQVRRVAGAPLPAPLPAADAGPTIRYRWHHIESSLDDYLARRHVTGLLVLKDCAVVAERYRYGRTPDARFLSFSMAKSVTSLLVGIALQRGAIASIDDPAQRYAPELAGSAYGATTIAQLLRMSSGLAFSERYDGHDDVARMARAAATGRPPLIEFLRGIGERRHAPGTHFSYAGAETEVLGRVLAGATGRSVSELTAQWLWQPIGARRDAFWLLAHDGHERVSGFFNASLRDWGRLGCMLARDGQAQGRQVVPREYLLEATDVARQPPAFRPGAATRTFGYGFQFWLLPLRERTFALLGIHGQAVYVQPASGIVMVQTAVEPAASAMQDPSPAQERNALWRGVLRSLGGSLD